ncbi:hypothetical protein GCM10017778_41660 [Streptomyces vinaceus]|nr:hypothetical protein GCM10017778_41660 [Streptomyces vinaceus]
MRWWPHCGNPHPRDGLPHCVGTLRGDEESCAEPGGSPPRRAAIREGDSPVRAFTSRPKWAWSW